MEYAGQSKRNILIVVILVISGVAIYNWFITPQTRYLAAARKYRDAAELMEKTSMIMSSKQKISRKELDKFTQQFELQKQNLFDTDKAKDFLANFQSVAEKSGCMVVNLKRSPIREIEVKDSNSVNILQYQVNMSLLGRYENIVEFLNTIQSRTAKVWVDSITIGMRDAASSCLACDITLSIYTLNIKEIQSNVNAKK